MRISPTMAKQQLIESQIDVPLGMHEAGASQRVIRCFSSYSLAFIPQNLYYYFQNSRFTSCLCTSDLSQIAPPVALCGNPGARCCGRKASYRLDVRILFVLSYFLPFSSILKKWLPPSIYTFSPTLNRLFPSQLLDLLLNCVVSHFNISLIVQTSILSIVCGPRLQSFTCAARGYNFCTTLKLFLMELS